jgi:hypothetical protein
MAASKRQLQREAKRATKKSVGSQGLSSTIRRTSDTVRSITIVDESPSQLPSAQNITVSLEQESGELESSPSAPVISEEDRYKSQTEQRNEQTQVGIRMFINSDSVKTDHGFRHVRQSISFYPTQLSFRTFCSSNTLTIARMNLATVSEVYDSSNVTNVSAYLPHANPVSWNGTGAYHFTGPLFGTQIRDITAKRITLRSYQQRRFALDTMTRVPRARHADQTRPSQSCTPTGFTAHSSDFANARVQMIG